MDGFDSGDREIIRELYFSSDWVSLYFFHKKYYLSPGQISQTIEKLSESNILEVKNHRVRLSMEGKKWVIKYRKEIFFDIGDKYWKEAIPQKFYRLRERNVQNVNVYCPKPGRMVKRFLENLD